MLKGITVGGLVQQQIPGSASLRLKLPEFYSCQVVFLVIEY